MSILFSRSVVVAAIIAFSGGTAFAASDDVDTTTTAANNSSDNNGLAEILVTARKRSENAQDTPISLTVVSGSDLERRSVSTLSDIQLETPSLKFSPNSLSPSTSILSGRGLSVVDARLTTDPAFGMYVDGVYLPRTLGSNASDLIDIDRIEVLNGPQGTLYGKNSTGGAVNVFTNLPTHTLEGLVKVQGGDYGDRDAALVLNVPIGESFAIRGVVQYNHRDGFGTNAFNDTAFGYLDASSVRLSALWTPTDNVTLLVRSDYSSTSSTGNAMKGPAVLLPNSLLITEVALETGLSPAAAGRLYQSYASGNIDDGSLDVSPLEKIQLYGYSATIDWTISANLALKSISAVRYIHRNGAIDLDGSPFQIFESPVLQTDDRQFSQEVQLQGNLFDNKLKYIFGGYYADEKGTELNVQDALGSLSGPAGSTTFSTEAENKTDAAFAQATYKLADPLSFTAGLRYTEDKRSLGAANQNNISCLSLGVSLASLAGAPCFAYFSVNFNAISYTGSVEYKVRPDILLYGKVDHGYRTGGLPENGGSAISPAAALLSFSAFKPEYAQSYEAGLKSEFFDRHARFNLALYTVTYSDLQRGITTPVPGTSSLVTIVQNVAKARVNGVEADATVLPLPGFELSATFGYTDPRYLSYTADGVDMSSQPFVFVPRFSYSVSAAHNSKLTFGSLREQLDYSWTDSMVTAIPDAVQSPEKALNARVTLGLDKERFEVSIFGKNLTDYRESLYPLSVLPTLGAIWNGPSNNPRTYGVEATERF
jgi:iron complex outermembrane recepter protein